MLLLLWEFRWHTCDIRKESECTITLEEDEVLARSILWHLVTITSGCLMHCDAAFGTK